MMTVIDLGTNHTRGGSITIPPGGGAPTTDDGGSIVITRLTATRVRGTFTATLAPGSGSGAPGPLAVTGGEFDIGLP